MTEKNDAFGAGERPSLTEEQRRENVAAVREAEGVLAFVEQQLVSEIFQLAQTARSVSGARAAIRRAFGMEPADPLPPLIDAAERLPDD